MVSGRLVWGGGAKQVLRGSGGMLEADLNFDNVKNDFSKS